MVAFEIMIDNSSLVDSSNSSEFDRAEAFSCSSYSISYLVIDVIFSLFICTGICMPVTLITNFVAEEVRCRYMRKHGIRVATRFMSRRTFTRKSGKSKRVRVYVVEVAYASDHCGAEECVKEFEVPKRIYDLGASVSVDSGSDSSSSSSSEDSEDNAPWFFEVLRDPKEPRRAEIADKIDARWTFCSALIVSIFHLMLFGFMGVWNFCVWSYMPYCYAPTWAVPFGICMPLFLYWRYEKGAIESTKVVETDNNLYPNAQLVLQIATKTSLRLLPVAKVTPIHISAGEVLPVASVWPVNRLS